MLVGSLEYRVESLQHTTIPLFQQHPVAIHIDFHTRVQHVEQRLVVLVYQYHDTAPRFQVHPLQQADKTDSPVGSFLFHDSVFFLPSRDIGIDHIFQSPTFQKITTVEVDMKHRILQPVLF